MTYGNTTQAAVGTAVIADPTGAAHHAQNQRAEQEAEAQQQSYAPPAQDDLTAELQQLADFYNRGLLADAEYVAARQKLLAG